jgi:integrase
MSGDQHVGDRAGGRSWFDEFVAFKRGVGYAYGPSAGAVRPLARDLGLLDHLSVASTKPLVEAFCEPRPGESTKTAGNRATLARQLTLFVRREGQDCWAPPASRGRARPSRFVPRIITEAEAARIISRADQRPARPGASSCKAVYSMLVRLLWSCGLRIGEAAGLRLADVDLDAGCLTIRRAKNGRVRLVPMSQSLLRHAVVYSRRARLDWADPAGFFFPSPRGGGYAPSAMSRGVQKIMAEAGVLREDGSPPSVVVHFWVSFCLISSSFTLARRTLAMILSAAAVQTNGLGAALFSAM